MFTHSKDDTNNDHQIINKATLIATRPGSSFLVNRLYSYEVLSSTEWKFEKTFKPNVFLELSTKDVKNKIKALEFYKSEIKKFPYPRSSRGIEVLSSYRGLQSGSKFAEAYYLIRDLKLNS